MNVLLTMQSSGPELTHSHVHEFDRVQLRTAAQRQKSNYDKKSILIEPGQFVCHYYQGPSANEKLGKDWVELSLQSGELPKC